MEGRSMQEPVEPGSLLRNVLLADAVLSAGVVTLLTLVPATLAGITGLPTTALRAVGFGLIPWVALLIWVRTRQRVPPSAIGWVIGLNTLGALVCLALAAGAAAHMSSAAVIFIAVNGLGALLLAAVQFVGWRRSAAGSA
jgi:hypothetical protein